MSSPSAVSNRAIQQLTQLNTLSPAISGPVLSVSSVVAIVVVLLTAVLIVALSLFLRKRSITRNRNSNHVENSDDLSVPSGYNIEMALPPIEPGLVSRPSTCDESAPPYEPVTLPRYLEKAPSPGTPHS